mmetsp:Transcript_28493/g.39768  ORF Transcript_28493/g.39768 Transcript_28493/m.39768 type:complete len:113 (+) Transcript_28493:176-514(+)
MGTLHRQNAFFAGKGKSREKHTFQCNAKYLCTPHQISFGCYEVIYFQIKRKTHIPNLHWLSHLPVAFISCCYSFLMRERALALLKFAFFFFCVLPLFERLKDPAANARSNSR